MLLFVIALLSDTSRLLSMCQIFYNMFRLESPKGLLLEAYTNALLILNGNNVWIAIEHRIEHNGKNVFYDGLVE